MTTLAVHRSARANEILELRWVTPDPLRFGAPPLLDDVPIRLECERSGARRRRDQVALD
jgi:hypothetical protein